MIEQRTFVSAGVPDDTESLRLFNLGSFAEITAVEKHQNS
ncbi:hypothetical protein FM102_10340 [Corynebacterium glutamicum]|nr:hypothetical protein FM102_10340 [Corynebacterium glutamicum]